VHALSSGCRYGDIPPAGFCFTAHYFFYQVGAGFDYTLEAYAEALDSLVERLELGGARIQLVAPGLLGGTLGALWAARHPEKTAKLTFVNAPLGATDASELPKCLKPLLNPFTAAIFCQNPLNVVGKPIEGAGSRSPGIATPTL
jgi:pimeloyl-ACP methyl ester carboxylesterase